MRILTALLIIVSALLSLLLGGFLFMSSKYEKFEAKVKAEEDLSSVASDLLDETELEKIRLQEQAQQQQNVAITRAGSRSLILGVLTFCAGLLQILSGVLILLRRAKIPVLMIMLLALSSLIAVITIEGPVTLGIIAIATSVAALGCHAPSLRRS